MRTLILFTAILISFSSFTSDTQVIKTQLRVTVLDDAGNLVQGATIQLYANEEDFNKEKNPISEKLTTDEKGVAKFDDLDTKVYYLLVEKGDMNNWGGGVQTDLLKAKKVNKINIIIE